MFCLLAYLTRSCRFRVFFPLHFVSIHTAFGKTMQHKHKLVDFHILKESSKLLRRFTQQPSAKKISAIIAAQIQNRNRFPKKFLRFFLGLHFYENRVVSVVVLAQNFSLENILRFISAQPV